MRVILFVILALCVVRAYALPKLAEGKWLHTSVQAGANEMRLQQRALQPANIGLATAANTQEAHYATLDPAITWANANKYCSAMGFDLCTFKDICPEGEGNSPAGANELPDLKVYVPIIGTSSQKENAYVGVTNGVDDGICSRTNNYQAGTHDKLPAKGETKSLVACCSTKHGQSRGQKPGIIKTRLVSDKMAQKHLARIGRRHRKRARKDDEDRKKKDQEDEERKRREAKEAVERKKREEEEERLRRTNPQKFRFDQPFRSINGYCINAGGWHSSLHPRFLSDVDGDGAADIVGFADAGVYVALSKKDGQFGSPFYGVEAFSRSRGGWSNFNTYPRYIMDVNGDKKADVVGFASDGVYIGFAKGGGRFGPETRVLHNQFSPSVGWHSQNELPRIMGDVNGDGRADIVGFAQHDVYLSLANSDGTFSSPRVVLRNTLTSQHSWTSFERYPRVMGDVNGDGKSDIVAFGESSVYVALSTGDGFQSPRSVLNQYTPSSGGWGTYEAYPRHLGDINGDGRADIVAFSCCSVCYSFGKVDGTFTPEKCVLKAFVQQTGFSSFERHPRVIGDIDGDGRVDIIGFHEHHAYGSFARVDA